MYIPGLNYRLRHRNFRTQTGRIDKNLLVTEKKFKTVITQISVSNYVFKLPGIIYRELLFQDTSHEKPSASSYIR